MSKRRDGPIVKPAHDPRTTNMVFTGRFTWWSPRRKSRWLPMRPFLLCFWGHMNENSFKSCVIQLAEPDVTVHIYANGKFTICGAISADDAILAIYQIMSEVAMEDELGIILSMYRFQLHNVVVAFAAGYAIDIAAFQYHNQWNTIWNPSKYIGLQHYPEWPTTRPCYVIHDTGATNGVGTSSHEAAVRDYELLQMHLYKPNGELSKQMKRERDQQDTEKKDMANKRRRV